MEPAAPEPSTAAPPSLPDPVGLLTHACELVRLRADKEWLGAGEVKNQMIRLDPAFDEAALGHANFSAFLRSAVGVVDLRETPTAGYELHLRTTAAQDTVDIIPAPVAQPRTMAEDLRFRLISTYQALTGAEEAAVVAAMQAAMRVVLRDPTLTGVVPRPALVGELTSQGVEEGVARWAAHTLQVSGLPLIVHDDDMCLVVNPDLAGADEAVLRSVFRRWTADRARNLDIEWGRLQLEQSTWAMHTHVEQVARQHLQMAVPEPKQIRMLNLLSGANAKESGQ